MQTGVILVFMGGNMNRLKFTALVATIALLILGTAFTSVAAVKYNWYKQGENWRCADQNGEDYITAWAKSGEDWFWLDDEGNMAKEALVDDDTKYVDADGKMASDKWVRIADDEDNDHWMYFQKGGKKLTGRDTPKPVSVGDKKYIFDENGYMMTGWVNEEDYDQSEDIDARWKSAVYYCGEEDDGAVSYGWRKIECFATVDDEENENGSKYWFWFQASGKKVKAPKSGYLSEKIINGQKYVFDVNGIMKSGWNAVYATKATGSNKDINNYAWFQSGSVGLKLAKGWFKTTPRSAVDATTSESRWFYVKSGKMYNNTIKTIDNKKYGFNQYGEMVYGLCAAEVDDESKFVRFYKENIDTLEDLNAVVYGENGSPSPYVLYYFSSDGAKDGSMKTGVQTIKIDGEDYNFYFSNKNGSRGQGLTGKQGSKYYYNGKKVVTDEDKAECAFYELKEDDGRVYVDPGEPVYFGEVSADLPVAEYIIINKTGTASTSGTKKDGNGYKAKIVKKDGVSYWEVSSED